MIWVTSEAEQGKVSTTFLLLFPFFFCVPKRRNKKMAPQPVLALRASLASRRGRDAEKLGLRPQTVPASFPPPSARRGRTNGGQIPLARSRAPERLPKRGFALFERSEFAKPRQHRGAQGIPPAAGQGATGGPFFGSFLWASKEMNRRIKRIPLGAQIAWQSEKFCPNKL